MIPAKEALKERYPEFLLDAVDWALSMDISKRPQDATELLGVLSPYLNDPRYARATEPASELIGESQTL